MTMIGIEVVGLMMFMRVYVLYRRQKWVYMAVALLLLMQVAVYAWLLTKGQAVPHTEESHVKACTMIFDPKISDIAAASAWLPLLYDTVVFALVLYRALPSIRSYGTSYIMHRLFEDGIIYYSAIFAVTLVLTIMIPAAPNGLKNIAAQLELLITVTMMSRITLNLKKSARSGLNAPIKWLGGGGLTNRLITFAETHRPEPIHGRMTSKDGLAFSGYSRGDVEAPRGTLELAAREVS
ncbi:hypothetical protein AX17_006222 [Amanita inopinata Kibby_2008]|nr:hypothetical protein AX17_006222 [Amanita inopinata Kibby_2008]